MFRLGPLWAALESVRPSGYAGVTDEASAMEAQGLQPLLVVGSARNIKVTYPDDFAVAAALLVQNRS
jgi:2-C-methyl-D-erythritol 4-phosphate cytidylyltransferase